MDRRLIEETFPIEEVSIQSLIGKRTHYGDISSLHIWWARRPLESSRVTSFAALTSSQNNVKNDDFIIRLSKASARPNLNLLKEAAIKILKENNGNRPKILDPFGGGGTIALENLRLGCETFSFDVNPVAVLIQKCTLEFPQKFPPNTIMKKSKSNFDLVTDVEKWSEFLINEVGREIEKFYTVKNQNLISSYIWSKTIICPSCKTEIPLLKSYLLSKKRHISLNPKVNGKKIEFQILEKEKMPKEYEKRFSKATSKGGKATCINCKCKFVLKSIEITKIFREKKSFEKLICIVEIRNNKKFYRIPNENDFKLFAQSEKFLEKKIVEFKDKFGLDPIPHEIIDTPDHREYEHGNLYWKFLVIMIYGYTTWQQLFNSRQKLALVLIIEKIRESYELMLKEGYKEEYAKAITSYLTLGLGRILDRNSKFSPWNNIGEKQEHTFGRQVIPVVFDYAESNIVSGKQGWKKQFLYVIEALKNLQLQNDFKTCVVTQNSALNIPYDDQFFDAVFTDPPYYDTIPYSVLSDYFYVWFKKSLNNIFPDLFSTVLTPKTDEAISNHDLIRGIAKEKIKDEPFVKTKESFESMISKSLKEIYRVLKINGIVIVVYAHKTTDGWETIINSLLDSGLIVTTAWPIKTEMKGRLSAQDIASLSSSIYMVCRKMKKEPHESYNNVKKQMREYLDKKLDFLWEQDIKGADFFISAIGSAIEVFGKYEKITDNADNEIKVPQLLEDVRKIVSEYAIKKVLHGDIGGEISAMTRFYVLWRSAYGQAQVPYDDARKLATSLGIPNDELNKGFIKQEKEFVRVIGPEDRSAGEIKEPTELIDVLHKVLILWRNGKKEAQKKLLTDTKYANNDTFRRVAQAISESLPNEIDEKRWIDGFLTGFTESSKSDDKQSKLF